MFEKIDFNILHSLTIPIYEHHGRIKGQMPSFSININEKLLETSSQNFGFKYRISFKAGVIDYNDGQNI